LSLGKRLERWKRRARTSEGHGGGNTGLDSIASANNNHDKGTGDGELTMPMKGAKSSVSAMVGCLFCRRSRWAINLLYSRPKDVMAALEQGGDVVASNALAVAGSLLVIRLA
jgi:hypothetical protein